MIFLGRKRLTERKKSPMFLALYGDHEEAAKILARKGAECAPEEQRELGNKYTKRRIQAESLQSKAQQALQAQTPQPTLSSTPSAPHPQPLQPIQPQSPSQHSEHSAIIQENKQLKQKVEELGETNKIHLKTLESYKEEAQNKTKQLEERLENTEAALQRLENIKRTLLLTRQLRFVAFNEMEVKNILGQGSHGIVFLVEIPLRNQTRVQLALKMILNYDQINTTKLSNHFVNEFNVLFKLVDIHPNIIHILADFTAAPTLQMIKAIDPSIHDYLFKQDAFGVEVPVTTQFFLIEYHPATLEQVLKERKLQAAEIYRFAGELLDCFVFLFENRVAHRDVKPENIFVSSDGSLILGDFGEAIELDENHCCSVHNLRAGNMRFAAPEVINQLASGKQMINFAKQYSWEVGCLLYEMVFGKFPFENYPMNFGKAPKISVPSAVFGASVVDVAFLAIINKLLINDCDFRISIKDAHSQFQQFLKR